MLIHPRQWHPAILCRDTMTGRAPASTSASPLTKKSITKGQRSCYYLNTENPRLLLWWFLMKQRTKTPIYRNPVSLGTGGIGSPPSRVFLDIHNSSKYLFPPALFLYGLVTSSFPLRLRSAPHTLPLPLLQFSRVSAETDADASCETADRSLEVNPLILA